jgi:hypothetical protein
MTIYTEEAGERAIRRMDHTFITTRSRDNFPTDVECNCFSESRMDEIRPVCTCNDENSSVPFADGIRPWNTLATLSAVGGKGSNT